MNQKKLFIIGNGFDLAHGIPTSYKEFHNFLIENYYDGELDNFNSPAPDFSPDGGIVFDDEEVVKFLRTIISNAEPDGENWSNVEDSLGKLEFASYLDNWLTDDDEEENEWHEMYRVKDISDGLLHSTILIQEFFKEWIDSVELKGVQAKKDFLNLINNNDMFLTFNYSKTLEDIYNAHNVCHIHGKQEDKILFGHGVDKAYTEDYTAIYTGAEEALQELHEKLRKRTDIALIENERFFKDLSKGIDCIYSFGFSFSDVDMIYIKEICRNTDTNNIVWYLNDFSPLSERSMYIDKITKSGFKGKFDTFSIK